MTEENFSSQEAPAEETVHAERTEGQTNDKIVAVLAYLLVGIIWYFADEKVKSSSFAKFHVKQSLNIMIVSVVVQVVLSILMGAMFMLIPLISLLSMLVNLAIFVLWVMGIIHAINGEEKAVPVIGDWAGKYLKF